MLNLHSHSRADLSRNHKVLDELTSLVEVSESSAAGDTRSLVTKRPSIQNTRCATRSVSTDPQIQFAESVEFDSQLPEGERQPSTSGDSQDSAIHPRREFPLPCHGANQAYDAGVESFQGQFGGEEE